MSFLFVRIIMRVMYFLPFKVPTKVSIPSDWGEWKREAVVSSFYASHPVFLHFLTSKFHGRSDWLDNRWGTSWTWQRMRKPFWQAVPTLHPYEKVQIFLLEKPFRCFPGKKCLCFYRKGHPMRTIFTICLHQVIKERNMEYFYLETNHCQNIWRTLRPKGEDAHDYTGGVYSGYNQETYL